VTAVEPTYADLIDWARRHIPEGYCLSVRIYRGSMDALLYERGIHLAVPRPRGVSPAAEVVALVAEARERAGIPPSVPPTTPNSGDRA
jgi:hypothetical protein